MISDIKSRLADRGVHEEDNLDVVVSVRIGSIVFMLSFKSVEQLDKFWQAYKDGSFATLLAKTFVTDELKEKYKLSSVAFILSLSDDDYDKCKLQLVSGADDGPVEASMEIQGEEIGSHCEKTAEAKRTEVGEVESRTGKR